MGFNPRISRVKIGAASATVEMVPLNSGVAGATRFALMIGLPWFEIDG
jgi:hypothetical protein